MHSLAVAEDRSGEFRRAVQEAHALSDEQIVERVRAGDTEVFEVLMRRYNQRIYRTARSILKDDVEAEEVVQEAWVRAFDHLDQFAGRAPFAAWVTRIALYEAWTRARRGRRKSSAPEAGGGERIRGEASSDDPEKAALDREMQKFIEAAIEALPEKYRLVFMLREVEGLSTAEAARSLALSRVAIKTRLHRARTLLRNELLARAGPDVSGSFRFLGRRCDRTVEIVMRRNNRLAGSSRRLVGPRRPQAL